MNIGPSSQDTNLLKATQSAPAVLPENVASPPNATVPQSPSAPGVNVPQLLLAIVLVAAFAELAYTIVTISAMPVYLKNIGLPKRAAEHWIGIVATAFIFVEGVLKSPFGLLGDRIGRKVLILAGPCVSVLTSLVLPHVQNPYLLVGLRILDGCGAAALWPAAFSLIGDHVPEERRAAAMSYFNLSYLMGIGLGPLIGGAINDYAHTHLGMSEAASKVASFYAASVLFLLTSVVAFLLIPNLKPHAHKTSVALGEGEEAAAESGFSFTDFKAMLGRMPSTLLMTYVTFMGIGLIMAYVKVFTLETLHITETQFGKLLIVPALVIAALSVPLGTLGDKIGKARAVKIGIGLCAFAFWTLILHFDHWTLMSMGALLGIGFVIAFPAWMALISSTCDNSQRGAVVGAVGTAQGLGAITGVILSSFLYPLPGFFTDTLPQHNLPFLGCALMLLVSFILGVLTIHEAPSCKTE